MDWWLRGHEFEPRPPHSRIHSEYIPSKLLSCNIRFTFNHKENHFCDNNSTICLRISYRMLIRYIIETIFNHRYVTTAVTRDGQYRVLRAGCRILARESGPWVNEEYLSQIQFYSIFSELPVTSNMVVIITVCVKVANSTGFPQIKEQSGLSYWGTIYACCFVR